MKQNMRTVLVAGAVLSALAAGCTQESAPELLKKAEGALAKGEIRTAEIHLKNLLKENADDAQARLLLARAYAATGNWPSAENEFRRALDLGAEPAQVAPGLLQAMFQIDEPAKVIEQAGKFKVDDAQVRAEVAAWTARAWMKRGDGERARQAFQDALSAHPAFLPAQIGLLRLQARQGDDARTRAQGALDALLQDNPEHPEALMLQAELRTASGDLQGARVPLEAVIAALPSDVMARSTLVAIEIELRNRDAARAQLAELLRRAPGWHVALTQTAQLDLLEGKQQAARDGAIAVLKLKPDYLPALVIAGATALTQGSLEQAEGYARQMVNVAPALSSGHRLLAATLLKRGEPASAWKVVEPLLRDDTTDARLLAIAGEAALRNGNAGAAEKYFARAANLDKEDAGKRVGLALARMGTGDREGALADLQAATLLTSDSTAADLILISALIRERKLDEAREAISRLEKKQDRGGEVPFLRGRVALAQGDKSEARGHFEKALIRDPALFPAVENLAALDLTDGMPAHARARYETMVKADPKSAPALMGLARLTGETGGKPPEVLDLLKRAHEADPTNESAALALAEALSAQGRLREAVELLQTVTKQNPGWIRALEALTNAYIRSDEPGRAHEMIDRLARLKPQDPGLQFRLGTLKNVLKDHSGALERYQRAQALEPRAIQPRVGIAQTQALLGRHDDAMSTVLQMQRDHPSNAIGWSLEADLHRGRQRWREAVKALRKAIELEPSQQAFAFKLHDSLLRAGSTDEASRLLRGWLEKSPNDERLNLYAGERQLAAKQFSQAIRHYEVAVAANPQNAIAHNNLAWSLHQLRDERALPEAEEAYRLAPNSAAVVDTLATILSESKQAQRGLELHERAAALAPRSAEFRLKLAKALKENGDKAEAKREFDTVVSEFPDSPQATIARRLSAEL